MLCVLSVELEKLILRLHCKRRKGVVRGMSKAVFIIKAVLINVTNVYADRLGREAGRLLVLSGR